MDILFVVPVLNGEQYIRQCIDSIVHQMEPADELVVVDNGSTDGTVEVVRSYRDKGVKLLLKPEVTVAALRNEGAKVSHGQLIAFIDSDCILSQGWRQKVVSVLGQPEVAATGSAVCIPEESSWVSLAWFSQNFQQSGYVNYINTSNLIVKREVFNNIGGFDENLISDEDCEFGEGLNANDYLILEDPEVRVLHLDNPHTLKDFYIRERWHATSAHESLSWFYIDRWLISSFTASE